MSIPADPANINNSDFGANGNYNTGGTPGNSYGDNGISYVPDPVGYDVDGDGDIDKVTVKDAGDGSQNVFYLDKKGDEAALKALLLEHDIILPDWLKEAEANLPANVNPKDVEEVARDATEAYVPPADEEGTTTKSNNRDIEESKKEAPAPNRPHPKPPANTNAAKSAMQAKFAHIITENKITDVKDVNALIMAVLRESYMQTTEDLYYLTKKVKFFNALKKAIRNELNRMRNLRAFITPYLNEDGSINVRKLQGYNPGNTKDWNGEDYSKDAKTPWFYQIRNATPEQLEEWGVSPDLAKWEKENPLPNNDPFQNGRQWFGNQMGFHNYSTTPGLDGEIVELKPDMSLRHEWWKSEANVGGKLDAKITGMEERLSSVGDDAALANVDLQNWLQRQQKTLQMMSNIQKMLYDTAMAIIRKISN